MELTALSLAGVQQKLRAKEVSPTEVVRALEDRIAKVDPQIHGYLSRDFDTALKLPESADISAPGPLSQLRGFTGILQIARYRR